MGHPVFFQENFPIYSSERKLGDYWFLDLNWLKLNIYCEGQILDTFTYFLKS